MMGFRRRSRKIAAKTPSELDGLEAAGAIVGQALVAVRQAAKPGVSLLDLDAIAEEVIRDHGAVPTFKGYHGFPGSICASRNDVIVHGIPTAEEILRPGDYLSIDCGATLDGWVGDSAWSFGVGENGAVSNEQLSGATFKRCEGNLQALDRATQYVLAAGIAAMIPGNKLTDVSHALETATRKAEQEFGCTFGIVDGYGGHGVGHTMHEEPFLANEGKPGRGPEIQAGSVLAIEPMLTLGSVDSIVLDDDWTVISDDGSWASHWEHTVAATDDGPRILTPRPAEWM